MNHMDFEATLERVLKLEKQRTAALNEFLALQSQHRQCAAHPEVRRAIDVEGSKRQTQAKDRPTVAYQACPRCRQEREAAEEREHLRRSGVPTNLLHCHFDNWTPRSKADSEQLRTVIEFAEGHIGFLVLLGSIGTGKTHLAVAAMRRFRSALLVKQSTLLRNLRETYRDKKAVDPVRQCQNIDLLVLDEMGISSGGRDELPLLHEILDHRYGERKATVLTGNLEWEELKAVMGERMADRVKQSAYAVLKFSGDSHRRDLREQYFEPGVSA